MYAVVNHLHLDIPVAQLKPALERTGATLLAEQAGFRAVYFVENDVNHATVILLWDNGRRRTLARRRLGRRGFASTSRHTWRASNSAVAARCSSSGPLSGQ
jgi:hypothetical protein